MNLKELKLRFFNNLKNNRNQLFVGPSGIGKTQTIQAWCGECEDVRYITRNLANLNPTHFTGFPQDAGDVAKFLPYDFLYEIINAGKNKLVVHIQDVIQGTAAVQAALMYLIQERRAGLDSIPENVSFVLDTNAAHHRAGGSQVIDTIVRRCKVYEFPTDVKGWIEWGLANGIDKRVIGYIYNNPDSLIRETPPKDIEPSPCPRAWEAVCEDLEAGFEDHESLAASVGKKEGVALANFIAEFNKLGFIVAKVKTDYETAPLFDQIPLIYASIVQLANKCDKQTIGDFVSYLDRYGNKEYGELLISLAESIHPEIINTRTYQIVKGG